MKETIRRAIISSVVAKVSGTHPSSIYSFDRAQYTNMGQGYDYEASAHFSDNYHYGEGSHMNIQISGNNFSGYDYGDGHHFSGTVNGRSVSIYDHGEGRHFNYTV